VVAKHIQNGPSFRIFHATGGKWQIDNKYVAAGWIQIVRVLAAIALKSCQCFASTLQIFELNLQTQLNHRKISAHKYWLRPIHHRQTWTSPNA